MDPVLYIRDKTNENGTLNNIIRNSNTGAILRTDHHIYSLDHLIFYKTVPFRSDRVRYVEYLDRASRDGTIRKYKINNVVEDSYIDDKTVEDYVLNIMCTFKFSDIKIQNLANTLTTDFIRSNKTPKIVELANNINNSIGNVSENITMLGYILFPKLDDSFQGYIYTLLDQLGNTPYYNIDKNSVCDYIIVNNIIVSDIYVVLDGMYPNILVNINKSVSLLFQNLVNLPFTNYYRTSILNTFGELDKFLLSKPRLEYLLHVKNLDFTKTSYMAHRNFLVFLYGDTDTDLLTIDITR
jgi:hypothetical protein